MNDSTEKISPPVPINRDSFNRLISSPGYSNIILTVIAGCLVALTYLVYTDTFSMDARVDVTDMPYSIDVNVR